MTIAIAARHTMGDFVLDVDITTSGRLTALFGPSGSGKTTLINVVAGLLRPRTGRVVVDDRVLMDSARNICLPVHRRRIGYVFQDARLLPHLTVRQNLAYGRWFAAARAPASTVARIVDMLGIGPLLDHRPALLSGGERQRVAIGRALLSGPQLLLMDEPLAALDEARKAEIIPYIERLRDEALVPILYVSHAVAEVSRLADHVVLLDRGRTTAQGSPAEVIRRLDLLPLDERAEGGSLIAMQVDDYDPDFDLTTLTAAAGVARVPGRWGPKGTLVTLRIRARDVMVATLHPDRISALNVFQGTVAAIAPSGPSGVTLTLDCGGTPLVSSLTRYSASRLGLTPGMEVYAVVKSVSVAPAGH
jgi:molybdate transport system ATP-binding protein